MTNTTNEEQEQPLSENAYNADFRRTHPEFTSDHTGVNANEVEERTKIKPMTRRDKWVIAGCAAAAALCLWQIGEMSTLEGDYGSLKPVIEYNAGFRVNDTTLDELHGWINRHNFPGTYEGRARAVKQFLEVCNAITSDPFERHPYLVARAEREACAVNLDTALMALGKGQVIELPGGRRITAERAKNITHPNTDSPIGATLINVTITDTDGQTYTLPEVKTFSYTDEDGGSLSSEPDWNYNSLLAAAQNQ